jgi:hypothetical protein
MSYVEVKVRGGQSIGLSFETRQHPLSEGSDIFGMQRRYVTTKTTIGVTEDRGYDEEGESTSSMSNFIDNGAGSSSYKLTSVEWVKDNDFCVWTKVTTVQEIEIVSGGWYNISSS